MALLLLIGVLSHATMGLSLGSTSLPIHDLHNSKRSDSDSDEDDSSLLLETSLRRWSSRGCEFEAHLAAIKAQSTEALVLAQSSPLHNVSLIVASDLTKPLSHLRKWGLQSCDQKRKHLAREKVIARTVTWQDATVTWQDTTFLDTPADTGPLSDVRKWCNERGMSPLLIICFLVLLCPAMAVIITVYMMGCEPVPRSHPDMPGVEFGAGSWAHAYRDAKSKRKEALKLLIQCQVITPFELSNDFTVISSLHVEECIGVAEALLNMKPREAWVQDPSEARTTFQGQITRKFNKRLPMVEEDPFLQEDNQKGAAFWGRTPLRMTGSGRASPGRSGCFIFWEPSERLPLHELE